MLEQVWSTGLPDPQLGHWRTADDGRRLIAWANKPLLDDDGTPLYLVTAGLDLTERGPASDELQRLHAELEERVREQSALRRVATAVASGLEPERVFDLVSEEAARVLSAEAGAVARYNEDETAIILGRWNAPGLGASRSASSWRATATERSSASGEPARLRASTTTPACRGSRRGTFARTAFARRSSRRSWSPARSGAR